ncbi:PP4R2-like protein [Mya arenaria]|uniref:PP4R2-like protein n=1 Tax=Mya arenaria TaxID=6604 RepID=A0ABY7FZ97_MYAAR|nr:PP4R2-like protein [Mya arenaria]
MENQDKIQTVLEDFEKEPGKEIPTVLEEYLQTVAKTGKTVFQWPLLKTLFVQKLEQVMDEFNKDNPCERPTPYPNVENAKFDDMRKRILEAMHRFTSAPFTIQRLCELFSQPKKHYTQCDKFLRGIEKMRLSTEDSSVSSSGSPGEQPSGEASDQQIGEAESTTQAEQSESTHTTQEDSGNSNEAEPSAVPDETPSDIGQPNSSSIQPDQSNDTLQSCDQTESEPNKVAVEKSDSKVEDSDNSGKCESTSDDTQVAEEHKENQAEVKEENNEASSEASTSKTDDISADTSQDEVEMETDSASEEKNAENVPVVDESEPMDQE